MTQAGPAGISSRSYLKWQPLWRQALGRCLFGALILGLLMGLAWIWIFREETAGISILSAEAWSRSLDFLENLIGTGSNAAYRQAGQWREVFGDAADTMAISLAAAAISGFLAILCVPASTQILRLPLRLLFALTRTIPELIWVLLILAAWGPGFAGVVLALSIHNFGVMGRLFADAYEVHRQSPQANAVLKTTGADKLPRFLYAGLPALMPQLVTFWSNRLEVIIRSTVVVGFVASAGLGFRLRLALSGRFFTEVALVLMAYFILVLLVDFLSSMLRRAAR